MFDFYMVGHFIFQSTLPVRGATVVPSASGHVGHISIHAPRAGSDVYAVMTMDYSKNFNPRSPCGERHNVQHLLDEDGLFQSTLPVRGATSSSSFSRPSLLISIHAPRAGSDRENSDHYPDFQIILVWLFVFGRT